MPKYLAARDIKMGSVDGDRWIKAGTEIDEGQIGQFPPGTYRVIDETTFPDGRCPTCGQMVATTPGQAGAKPTPVEQPPSVQKEPPSGQAATDAAYASMRNRPDNADSGQPSWGKIPIDVEQSIVRGQVTQRPVTAVPTSSPNVRIPPPGQTLSPDERRKAAEQAPKPAPNTMGGFGSGGETVGAGAAGAGTTTASGDALSQMPAVGSGADAPPQTGAKKP